MNAMIRVIPLVRSLVAIAAERAISNEWEVHPTLGIEVDADMWARKYQAVLCQLQAALGELDGLPSDPLGESDDLEREPTSFQKAHRRLSATVTWLLAQGFSVLAYQVGREGFPEVRIAFAEAAQQRLRMFGVGRRTDRTGKVFIRFSALHQGVRICWEVEESQIQNERQD